MNYYAIVLVRSRETLETQRRRNCEAPLSLAARLRVRTSTS
eukprot:COSAG02_NODE_51764_length_312_cov_0.713615_2_plen_40_part_01